jgi:hypothetical protein
MSSEERIPGLPSDLLKACGLCAISSQEGGGKVIRYEFAAADAADAAAAGASSSSKKKSSNNKNRNKNKKNASDKETEKKHDVLAPKTTKITWGSVESVYFQWGVGHCVVPARGGTPLGFGVESEELRESVSVDAHQAAAAAALLLRAKDRGIVVSPPTSSSSSSSSSKGGPDGWDVLLETRQRDYKKSNNKNPLYGPVTEEERVVLLSKVILKGRGGRSNSMSDYHEVRANIVRANRGSIDSTTSRESVEDSSSSSNNGSNNGNGGSTATSFDDVEDESAVAELNRDLKALRISREASMGCTCRPVKLDKLSVVKMKTELTSRFAVSPAEAEGMNKAALASTLKAALKNCPLCVDNNCECVQLGVDCRADTCECLRRRDQQACANPNGTVVFDIEAIKAHRKRLVAAM